MCYQAMRIHGGTLNAYYSVKAVNLKRLRTIWFQPDLVLGEGKLCRQ